MTGSSDTTTSSDAAPASNGRATQPDATPRDHGSWIDRAAAAYWAKVRHQHTPEERRRVVAVLFPELHPETKTTWRARFVIPLTTSVVIAVMGLTANSAAVVIGAMLIAPLMRPVLAFAAACVIGWRRRAVHAAVVTVGATVGSVALAALLARLLPVQNLPPEVLSRTSPQLSDLAVAFAAGIAGSYATVREDLSSSLPGVAVAVALVPPLGVVGICIEAGRSDLAAGAALLYAANLVAIVTSAAVVFVLAGFVPAPHRNTPKGRAALFAVAATVGVLAVAVPLTTATVQAARSTQRTQQLNEAVTDWIGTADLSVSDVTADGDTVVVAVVGATEPPSAAPLAVTLGNVLDRPVTVTVRWTQSTGRSSDDVSQDAPIDAFVVDTAVDTWLDGTGLFGQVDLIAGSMEDPAVTVDVFGPVPPPSAAALASLLSDRVGVEVGVTVRWTEQITDVGRPGDAAVDPEAEAAAAVALWADRNRVTIARLDIAVAGTNRAASVDALITSPTAPTDAESLAEDLRGILGEDVIVNVRWQPNQPIPTSTTTTTTTTVPAGGAEDDLVAN